MSDAADNQAARAQAGHGMPIEDFIKIRGTEGDAPFQGIGGTVSTDDDTGDTGDTGSSSIDQSLWDAQSAFITGESSYFEQLNRQWKKTQHDVEGGVFDGILSTVSESIEEMISMGIFAVLAKYGIILTGGAAAAVGVLISVAAGFGLGYLKDAFLEWLTESNKLLDAMIAENAILIAVECSAENYGYREQVIDRHERAIIRMLQELESYRRSAEQMTSGGGSVVTTDDDWDSVASTLESNIGQIETWLTTIEAGDADNLPVPVPPGLPAPPSSSKNAMLKISYLVAKYGIKFMMENFRKQRQNDVAFTDLVEAVNDLKFNGARIHTSSGDVIELTGIGTFAESYDT